MLNLIQGELAFVLHQLFDSHVAFELTFDVLFDGRSLQLLFKARS